MRGRGSLRRCHSVGCPLLVPAPRLYCEACMARMRDATATSAPVVVEERPVRQPKRPEVPRDATLVRAVKKMHPAEWARIRPCCQWAEDGIDLDTYAARIVIRAAAAKASGVLS